MPVIRLRAYRKAISGVSKGTNWKSTIRGGATSALETLSEERGDDTREQILMALVTSPFSSSSKWALSTIGSLVFTELNRGYLGYRHGGSTTFSEMNNHCEIIEL